MINNPKKFFTSLLIFSASLIFYSMFLVWNASALQFKASPEYFILHGASVVFGKVVAIDVVSSNVINEPVSREKKGYTVGERIETGFVVLEVLQNPAQDIKQSIIRIPFERRRFFNPEGEIVSVSKGEPQGFDAINLRPQMTLLIYCKRQGDVYELSQVASNTVQELSEDQLPDFTAIMKKVNQKVPDPIQHKVPDPIQHKVPDPIQHKVPDPLQQEEPKHVDVSPEYASALLPLSLQFDGKRLESTATPDFSCYSYTTNKWINCGIEYNESAGGYLMRRPALGKYRMHVSIDENKSNPRRYPGDFEAILKFEVTENTPETLTVNVPRLIHLKSPGNNNQSMEGILGPCEKKPVFETPLFFLGPGTRIPFSWDPVVDGAQYSYEIYRAQCSPFQWGEKIAFDKIAGSMITLDLPPNEDGEFYLFKVTAQKEGRLVGDFFTHDSGSHSWNYRFRVINKSIPHWVYYIAVVVLLSILFGLRSFVTKKQKGSLIILIWGSIIVFMFGLLSVGIYYAYKQTRQNQAQKIQDQQQEINRRFIKHWQTAAPLPEWWEEIAAPAYKIDTLGDLMSAWQSGRSGRDENRQFFKAAYQAILEHPDDYHIVPQAIHLLHYVSQDYSHRIEMEEFGIEHFFDYKQRTDNCANCMVGDTVQGMVNNLAYLYLQQGDYDKAVNIIERLLKEREHEISGYKLARTYNVLGRAYWKKGLKDNAITVLRRGVQKYGDTVHADGLKMTLKKYEKEFENVTDF